MNAILGACVGDAAGATLEFMHDEITEEIALNAMKMPGGGAHRVGPGQITDDGELTLALWNAIHTLNPADGFPYKAVIKAYASWYGSCPFDMGQTCSFAFEHMCELLESCDITTDVIYALKTAIYKDNCHSEANGALMRATAIATWIAKHTDIPAEIGAELAMEDASLSHPNQVCKEVNAIYVFIIIHLLRGISPSETLQNTGDFILINAFSDKVKKWYFEESLDISTLNCKEKAGHVRWGFVLAVYFARHPEISYEDAIRITLMKGGDTDTNAAIVGGLVAAYNAIPEYMRQPVLDFDCIHQQRERPSEYSVGRSVI